MKTEMKMIVASVVVLALALTAVSGITYSWFSDSETAKVDVTTGHIEIETVPTEISLSSGSSSTTEPWTGPSMDVEFPYGGGPTHMVHMEKTDTGYNVKINGIVDQDLVKFSVKVTNNSTLPAYITCDASGAFGDLLDVDIVCSGSPLDVDIGNSCTFTISIKLKSGATTTPPATTSFEIKFTGYQGNYASTIHDGTATITGNKIVSGDIDGEGSAKDAGIKVDFSEVTKVNDSINILGSTITVKSKLTGGISNEFGTIDLILSKDGVTVSPATFDEPVKVTAVFKNVEYNPGDVIIKCGSETISSATGTYDSSAKTFTVEFQTTHFSSFTIETSVASVGSNYYFTLEEAFSNANNGDTLTILAPGTYTIPKSIDKSITIDGLDSDRVTFDTSKTSGQITPLANEVVFQNITLKLNGANYTGFQHSTDISFIGCKITGQLTCYGKTTFDDCTFDLGKSEYLWTYGADVSFDKCVFNTKGKAILIYNENGYDNKGVWSPCYTVSNVSVKNCDFNATEGDKSSAITNYNCAAVEIDNRGVGVNLTLENNSIDPTFSGEWRIKTFAHDDVIVNGVKYFSPAVDGKTITIVGGVATINSAPASKTITTADELLEFANDLAKDDETYYGAVITISGNIDMTGKVWPIIKLSNKTDFLKIEGAGDGAVISNLNISSSEQGGVGLIAYTGSMTSLCIENIELKDLKINASTNNDEGPGVGGFIGYAGTTDWISIIGCKVTNAVINGGHWAGGIVGYAAGWSILSNGPVFEVLSIKDCTVTGTTIETNGSVGGIIGHATGDAWTRTAIDNPTVKGCKITFTGTSDESKESTIKAGSLIGTVGAGNTAYGKNGGTWVTYSEENVDGNTVRSGDLTIDKIYGRQGSGGVLVVNNTVVFPASTA